MQIALSEFRQNIARCRLAVTLYTQLTVGADPLDLDDLLRYTLASSVSATDRYVHHVVELGMMECLGGTRAQTPSYLAFKIAMSGVHEALSVPKVPDWFLLQVRSQNGFKSFQKSKAIHEAVNLIKSVDIWAQIALTLSKRVSDLRLDYDLYVERRNAIVHQADIDVTTPGALTPISLATTQGAVDLIEQIVEAMHLLL